MTPTETLAEIRQRYDNGYGSGYRDGQAYPIDDVGWLIARILELEEYVREYERLTARRRQIEPAVEKRNSSQ